MDPVVENFYGHTKKDIVRSLLITALFNLFIAAGLKLYIFADTAFVDILIISQCIGLTICLFITTGLHVANIRTRTKLAVILAFGLVAGACAGTVLGWGYLYLTQAVTFELFIKKEFHSTIIFGILFGIPITYFFVSVSRISFSEKKIREEKIKRLTIEKEAAQTKLKMLQAQIEPHFLFNTLSNILSLIDADIEKGKSMLIDLTEYLRISLSRTRESRVTLKEELELVKCYLNIFKIRMGKRLAFEIITDEISVTIPFPPLIVQPLVENAIKHGLEPQVAGGQIKIECFVANSILKIIVSDTGPGIGDNDLKRSGIGIDNVSQRLNYLYGEKGKLLLCENQPKGLKAIIEVPV